jgi:hypothetical protein
MIEYPSAAVFEKKIYIGGGEPLESDWEGRIVIVCDFEQKLIYTLPQYTCKQFSMVVINNQLVLVGGVDVRTGKVTNELGVWNINEQSKRWTHPLPPITTACRSPSVATYTLNNRCWLVVIGGLGSAGNDVDDSVYLSRVEILDTESRQWYHAASLPQPLICALPATIGNMCYLLGGYTESEEDIQCHDIVHVVPSKKVFSVCLDDIISEAVSQSASASAPPTPSPWLPLPDTPLEKSTGLAFNGGLLAVGGTSRSTRTATYMWSSPIYYYQPTRRSWAKVEDNGELQLQSRSGCTCAVLPSGDLFIAGGVGAEHQVVIVSEN